MTNLPKSASPSEPRTLKERLSHASGALSDIATLVTDCVSKSDPPRMHEICEAVLQRILTSADRPRTRPSWFRHDWEKALWERYESGELKACASDKSCETLAAEPRRDEREAFEKILRSEGHFEESFEKNADGTYLVVVLEIAFKRFMQGWVASRASAALPQPMPWNNFKKVIAMTDRLELSELDVAELDSLEEDGELAGKIWKELKRLVSSAALTQVGKCPTCDSPNRPERGCTAPDCGMNQSHTKHTDCTDSWHSAVPQPSAGQTEGESNG